MKKPLKEGTQVLAPRRVAPGIDRLELGTILPRHSGVASWSDGWIVPRKRAPELSFVPAFPDGGEDE